MKTPLIFSQRLKWLALTAVLAVGSLSAIIFNRLQVDSNKQGVITGEQDDGCVETVVGECFKTHQLTKNTAHIVPISPSATKPSSIKLPKIEVTPVQMIESNRP